MVTNPTIKRKMSDFSRAGATRLSCGLYDIALF
jgi:hypothetical protein